MNTMDLIKNKKYLLIFVSLATIAAVGAAVVYSSGVDGESLDNNLDFSNVLNKNTISNVLSKSSNQRQRIVVPDPSYKEAPEFEDFQAITKMFVHAMKPYKKDTQDWESTLLSQRIQRKKIALFADAAEAAENEARMYEFRARTKRFKSGSQGDSKPYSANVSSYTMQNEDVREYSEKSTGKIHDSFNIRDVRMTFYTTGNKYSVASASFAIGSEQYNNVKIDDIFASQFLVQNLLDDKYCAVIKDRSNAGYKSAKICRN